VILVVDDNADMRLSLKRLLEQLGHCVEVAADGNHAVEVQRVCNAHVLITDIFMPGKEGIETIETFRRRWPAVKIIAMSGGGTQAKQSYLGVATTVGADATLTKPFSLDALLDALASVGLAFRKD
jgi:CheY-like chemotaxis protein